MIQVDGSIGEGGGQVLRTAVSLSAILQQGVHISRIRAGRPNPGLAAQHVTCIEAVADLCNAEVDGLHVGSKDISFQPGVLTGGSYEFDIGTAGSIPLVLQACLLPASMSRTSVTLTLRGGTDTKWAPPIDFVRLVHLPMVERLGVNCDLEVIRRGFYPEGGGEVVATIYPSPNLRCAGLDDRGKYIGISGAVSVQNLPDHVMSRMKHASLKRMVGQTNVKVDSQVSLGVSTGAVIVLAARYEGVTIGTSALGQKGVRAETLGEICADDLLESMDSGATVDEHMSDQILPYMALAKGRSVILAEELTGHADTNIRVIEMFLGKRFETSERGALTEIRTV